jgi:acyl-CoA thioesterase-2
MTDRFSDLLPLEPAGDDRFVARPAGTGFLFGGLSLAVILRAASRTVDGGKAPMSLRATFLAGGDWGGPHDLTVERVHESRAFAGRRVEMVTGGRVVVVADAVFHQPEEGADRQTVALPDVPPPAQVEPDPPRMPVPVIEVRPVEARPTAMIERLHPYWGRTLEALDDPADRACALSFISDYMVIGTPFPPGSGTGDGLMPRTLEHSVWFHRPLRSSGWWLFSCDALSVAAGRYHSRGTVHAPEGDLVASFVQHGFIRPMR